MVTGEVLCYESDKLTPGVVSESEEEEEKEAEAGGWSDDKDIYTKH